LQPFDGDLDDYKDWLFKTKLSAKNAAALPPASASKTVNSAVAPSAPVVNNKEAKRAEAEDRQRLAALKKPIESRIKKLEEQIAKRQAQKAVVDARLADPEIYDQAKKKELKQLLTDQTYYRKEVDTLEAEWMKEQDALEQLTTPAV
jgi:ATP-binding cassette subfamily F protein 3